MEADFLDDTDVGDDLNPGGESARDSDTFRRLHGGWKKTIQMRVEIKNLVLGASECPIFDAHFHDVHAKSTSGTDALPGRIFVRSQQRLDFQHQDARGVTKGGTLDPPISSIVKQQIDCFVPGLLLNVRGLTGKVVATGRGRLVHHVPRGHHRKPSADGPAGPRARSGNRPASDQAGRDGEILYEIFSSYASSDATETDAGIGGAHPGAGATVRDLPQEPPLVPNARVEFHGGDLPPPAWTVGACGQDCSKVAPCSDPPPVARSSFRVVKDRVVGWLQQFKKFF